VTVVEGEFHENSGEPVTRSVPLSHTSIELGHLYPEDLLGGPARLRAMFADAAPWAHAARTTLTPAGRRARVSTCFLVDDYFGRLPTPGEVIPELVAAAEAAGLTIDYLAREAACAETDGPAGRVSPAALFAAALVDEPPPGSLGVRPPAAESGWLCNGVRSTSPRPSSAMDVPAEWNPPRQNSSRRHSIFIDVQLWDGTEPDRTYSCPMLAAVWQALRLGLLRGRGEPVVEPVDTPGTWPDRWDLMPAVTRLNPQADPFAAYTTVSVLPVRFLLIEAAVRTIVGQVRFDPAVLEQTAARARQESLSPADEVLDRISYAFAGRSDADPI
jgi:hypothetical protein